MFVKKSVFKTVELVVLLIMILIFVFPFLWMFSTSLKSLAETMVFPPKWLPSSIQWENFMIAWQSGPFLKFFVNSLVVAIGILVLQFLTIVPAAYAFARYEFKGKGILFGLTMIALMIPSQITFLPIYLQMSSWGVLNTYIPLIVPFATSAFGIFLLRQAFMQVPEELVEAARLDQANEWKIMWRIMVPLAKPVLVTFGLFSFIYHWNDYFWPLVMTNTEAVRTLPIGIAMLKDAEGSVAWNIVMAGNMILVLPILLVFFIAQRQIIRAFVYSGVK
ncbi:carbohydrate ABC transporter permease [Bacillus salitolerans]|uniref:Carbohydrate ABC transporter permease n=1 Tax=Bacillus salitolerans TaxID=1437434 RepID=A0ABW4LUW4_9BACI